MKIEFKEDTLFLKGFLDESTRQEFLERELKNAQNALQNNSKYLKINFSEVSMANSVGILKWLKAIDTVSLPICYSQAPKWLVSQLNMIPQFMKNQAVVESFEVPFYCEEKDKDLIKLFVVGKDIETKSESYTEEDFPPVEKEGFYYIVDVIPKNYFRFITDNFSAFQNFLAE